MILCAAFKDRVFFRFVFASFSAVFLRTASVNFAQPHPLSLQYKRGNGAPFGFRFRKIPEISRSAKKYSIAAGHLSSLRRGMRFYPAAVYFCIRRQRRAPLQAPSAAWQAIRKSSRSKAAKQDESPADDKPAPDGNDKCHLRF